MTPPEPERVVIADPDPRWPARFADAALELRTALGDVAERIDHIGSTAVAGLSAKDVIDVQVSLPCFEPAAAYDAPLGELGYVLRPDPEEPQHRFYRRPDERRGGSTSISANAADRGSAVTCCSVTT